VLVPELDDVTYDLEIDGEQVRRTLHRKVWEERAWATVAIVYEERAKDGTWRAPKLALIRLQRAHDAWKKHAALTLSGAVALDLAASIEAWRVALDHGPAADE
jgi:hypothetical protein